MPSLKLIKLHQAPRVPIDDTIPHEVIKLHVENDWSMVRAWREYLGVTQVEMAQRLEVRQPTYANMESVDARPEKRQSHALPKH